MDISFCIRKVRLLSGEEAYLLQRTMGDRVEFRGLEGGSWVSQECAFRHSPPILTQEMAETLLDKAQREAQLGIAEFIDEVAEAAA